MKSLTLVVPFFFALLPLAVAADGAQGTIVGEIKVAPGVEVSDTVVYIKKASSSMTGRKLTLDESVRLLTAKVGDTLELPPGSASELRPVESSGEPLRLYERDGKQQVKLAREGIYVRLWGERKAYLFIGQNPFSATVDERGRFVITNVPPGDYELAVWNPWARVADQQVRVQPGSVTVNFILQR